MVDNIDNESGKNDVTRFALTINMPKDTSDTRMSLTMKNRASALELHPERAAVAGKPDAINMDILFANSPQLFPQAEPAPVPKQEHAAPKFSQPPKKHHSPPIAKQDQASKPREPGMFIDIPPPANAHVTHFTFFGAPGTRIPPTSPAEYAEIRKIHAQAAELLASANLNKVENPKPAAIPPKSYHEKPSPERH